MESNNHAALGDDIENDHDAYAFEEDGDNDSTRTVLPHYMRPNFTSLLPEYANAEVDQIRGAFSTNNFASLHKLPSKLATNTVNLARFEHMDENRMGETNPKVPKIVTKNGLFSAFEYTPSRFGLADELASMERLASEVKRQAISGTAFVSASDTQKLKHEDAFGNDPQYAYPHLHEPYPDLRDEQRHTKWLADKKLLHGAFVPSGTRLPVDAVTRLLLPELLAELHEVLAQDWPETEFSLAVADDETIVARFSEATLDGVETGLIAYMNVFIKAHRVATKYKLHKVAEDWNAKPGDGGLYFVLRPPWVKNRSRDMIVLVPK